jgi:hypothetical protein
MVLVALLLGAAVPAHAQGASSPRPYQGLFGGNNGPDGRAQALDFTMSLFGGYDDNVLAGKSGGSSGPNSNSPSGYLAGLTAGISYWRDLGRSSFSASAAPCVSPQLSSSCP